MTRALPPGTNLAYGVATSSYQIEGATDADGRGRSIWDTFTDQQGTVVDGSDGSVACSSYERLDEDLDLVAGLGAGWYRFSVAWPRVQPTGSGAIEERGLAYYERLVDGLLQRGVQPLPTLYHWDLPQPLEDAGGWPVRDTAERFAEYAAVVHDRLGDRVGVWATLNEPWCAAYLGYAAGVHAPGRRDGDDAHRAAHHLVLAHALGAARLHDAGCEAVGWAPNLTPVWPERPEARDVADRIDALRNRLWVGPVVDGAYDDGVRAVATPLDDSDLVRDGDLELAKGSADWVGINYYTPARVDIAGPDGGGAGGVGDDPTAYPGAGDAAFRPRPPLTDMGWEIEPLGLERLLVEAYERVGVPLVVTENGAAYADDTRDADGRIDDADRIAYLNEHLGAVERARAAGADVRIYCAWTLLDNFEWAEGYTKTFGLVEVDRSDQSRRPKASYDWFAARAQAGSLSPDA